MRQANWPAEIKNFGTNLAWGTMPCGRGVKGAVDNRCPHCGGRQDSIGHWLEDCSSLAPLRDWLQTVWRQLEWPGEPPRFSIFVAYGYAQRSPGTRKLQVVQGALLEAARLTRHLRIAVEGARSVTADEAWPVHLPYLRDAAVWGDLQVQLLNRPESRCAVGQVLGIQGQ